MRLFYDDKKRNIWQKMLYILKHPWSIKYWLKEVGLGVRNVFRENSAKMIISLCAAIIGVLFIIAVFFYNLGKFVVTVDPRLADEGIVLSTDKSFKDVRYKLFSAAVEECNNININDIPLDVDDYDGSHNGDDYVAYTFYIKNQGKKVIDYNYHLDMGKKTKGIEKATWIMMIKNGEPQMYAMKRAADSPERQYSYEEFPIMDKYPQLKSLEKELTESDRGYLDNAEQQRLEILTVNGLRELTTIPFIDNKLVMSDNREEMAPGDIDKYTIVIWLEGEDPECIDEIKGGTIEFKMVFDVLENKSED